MATLLTPNLSHSVTGPSDDNMEISSDAGQQQEDYLDIDIDLGDQSGNINADEYMLEDETLMETNSISESNQFRDDDMMDKIDDEDGFMVFGHETQDEELQDATLYDEGDIEVADSQEYPEDNIDEETVDSGNNLDSSAAPQSTGDADDRTVGELYATLDLSEDLHAEASNEVQLFREPQQNLSANIGDEALQGRSEGLDDTNGDSKGLGIASDPSTDTSPLQLEELAASASVSMPVQLQVSTDGAKSPENTIARYSPDLITEKTDNTTLHQQVSHDIHAAFDPHAHPVIIVYDGQEIDLFPATEGNEPTQFFLSDRSTVDATLLDFLASCRTVLRDHVTENEALEIDVAELGMTLNEDSNQASLFSLADVLDVYVQLCQNDGINSPDPLYISLVAKPRFASRMTDLSTAIRDGKGFSAVFPIENIDAHSSESGDFEHVEANVEEHHNSTTEDRIEFNKDDGDGKNDDEVILIESQQKSEVVENRADNYGQNLEDVTQPVLVDDVNPAMSPKTSPIREQIDYGSIITEPRDVEESIQEESFDDDAHKPITDLSTENEGEAEEQFDDDLLDYSDEEENDQPADVYSSSSSTVQGETSVPIPSTHSLNDPSRTLADNSALLSDGLTTEVTEDHETSNFDTALYENEEDGIDYSVEDHPYLVADQEEYQDELDDDYEEYVAENDDGELGDGSITTELGNATNHSSSFAPAAVSVDDAKQSTTQAGGQQSPPASTPTLKRSRIHEEDELEDSDSENDAKKARSS